MKRVLLRAPVLTQSGYGVHSRQVARWLLSRGDVDLKVQALRWGDTSWILNREMHEGLVNELMNRVIDVEKVPQFDVTFQLQLPNEWEPRLGRTNVGMTAGVEADRCNPQWIDACNKMTRVIVPSKHVASCFTSTGKLNTSPVIVPEAYIDAIRESGTVELPEFQSSFNFLVFGQLTGDNPRSDRKNTFFTLKWLIEEFRDDPNVGIVLKTNCGRSTLIDRNKVVLLIKNVVNEVRGKSIHPRVHVLHGDMTDVEVASLYRHPQIKALVTATRGEGFGLPILEAGASGMPIIATGWSGHLDYLSHGRYISLYYNMEEVDKSRIDGQIFVQGARWACPTEQDFKKKVRKFYSSPQIPQRWADELSVKLREMYSQSAVNHAYDEALKDILC